MLDYVTQIKPLEAAGKTDAEIVAAFKSDSRHVRNIMATSTNPDTPDILGILVGRYQLLRLGADATWKGPLADYFAEPNVDQQLKAGFEMLLSQLQISNRRIWCNEVPAQGFLVTAMTQVAAGIVMAMGGDAAQLQADMDALTGGLIYANVTEQHIADARNAHVRAAALAPYLARLNAIGGWLTALDTSALTIEEITNYCDGLFSSSDGNPSGSS